MRVTRRRFIGFTAGAAAGAALGWPAGKVLSELLSSTDQPIYPPGGPEQFVLSICRQCPGGCGIRVRCIGGRPVKLDGNPLHPVSGGRLCPKGQAALQSLYHPDRLRGPMRRVGSRGSLASFQRASWDEALDEIALRLKLLRRQQRPEALALVRGPSRGLGARIANRFLETFGSPNEVAIDLGDEVAAQALSIAQGVRKAPAYDVQSAEYILSFGNALLEASSSPVYAMRAYGEFRQGRAGRRGKLVQVEARRSVTAAMADEWVQVRPGTEGLLALGIAHVLEAESLYDKEFVEERTKGFEDESGSEGTMKEGLRTLLRREFSLERVSVETGVSLHRILQLGREFAAVQPAIALGPRRGPLLPGHLFDHLAAQLLNALVGNLDGPGGLLIPQEVPLAPWPDLPPDPLAEAGRARPRLDGAGREDLSALPADLHGLAEAIVARSPYQLEALFCLDADPAFASTAPAVFAAAVEQIPLVVSFSSMPDDTALLADWILPDAHFLESWEVDTTPPGVPFPEVSLAKPVLLEPEGDVRPVADVFLDLARRIGGPVSAAFPWSDLPELARQEVEGLFQAQRGTIMGTAFDEAWVRLMERAGWWAPGYRTGDELWDRMQETGGWNDPIYDHWNWQRVLRHPSARFELRPDILETLAERKRVLPPSLSPASEPPAERHLALLLFEPLGIAGGFGAELPYLPEILDPEHEERWETWVELHPETAANLEVDDRSWVRVISPHGSIRVRARLTRRVAPGAVAVPVGLGKRGGGRWSSGVGANPLTLLSPVRETMSGVVDLDATRVRVVPDAHGV